MSGLDPTPQATAAWMEAFTAALQALFGGVGSLEHLVVRFLQVAFD